MRFERRAQRTVLAERRHDGPLVVQKPLYPEGDAVCHTIVVHPPGGIAGGDDLELCANAGEGAHALLTTPGASKWYRSAGPAARQHIGFDLKEGARLEWLPQETIVFDGAIAEMRFRLELADAARYIGWEILCLGRTGSGERFSSGQCRFDTEIRREGKLIWVERGDLRGGGTLLDSPAGLDRRTVCATMIAAAGDLGPKTLAACRKAVDETVALTLLPGLLIARSLGDSSEAAKSCFTRLWSVLRFPLLGREAERPRIWST